MGSPGGLRAGGRAAGRQAGGRARHHCSIGLDCCELWAGNQGGDSQPLRSAAGSPQAAGVDQRTRQGCERGSGEAAASTSLIQGTRHRPAVRSWAANSGHGWRWAAGATLLRPLSAGCCSRAERLPPLLPPPLLLLGAWLLCCSAGELSAEELESVMTIVSNPRAYKIPDWFLNRQKDVKDGRYSQVGGGAGTGAACVCLVCGGTLRGSVAAGGWCGRTRWQVLPQFGACCRCPSLGCGCCRCCWASDGRDGRCGVAPALQLLIWRGRWRLQLRTRQRGRL